MNYEIVFSEGAVKDLKQIPTKDQLIIIDKIELLSSNPFPRGHKRIKIPNDNFWRIRQGNYRILYSVETEVKIIDVRRIGHRRNIYDIL